MVDSKCDILFVTRNFPPLVGGMERLNHYLHAAFSRHWQVALIGPRGCEDYVGDSTQVSSHDARQVGKFILGASLDTYREARILGPKVLFAGSGLMGLAVKLAAGRIGAKAVCYVHGLDIVARNAIYQRLFVPAIRKMDRVWVNSNNTRELAIESGVSPEVIRVIAPPVRLPEERESVNSFREQFGLEGRKIILSVGRLTLRKGIAEFTQEVLPKLARDVEDTCLVVIGGEAGDAVKASSGQIDRLRQVVEETGLQNHVKMLGRVDDKTLRDAYEASDLLVLPVLSTPGDVEGFGMVATEAAAHGLPTVAFASGGVPDAVSQGVSGYLVQPGDYAMMTSVIRSHLTAADRGVTKSGCIEFSRQFSLENFDESIRRNMIELLN